MSNCIGKLNFSQITLSRKGKISYGGYYSIFNSIGNGYVFSMSCVRTDFYSSVIKNNICIRYTVILVYPVGIESKITIKGISIIIQGLCTFYIVIPPLKHRVKSFGLRKILERIAVNEYLRSRLYLIGKIIKSNSALISKEKSVYVYRTVSVIVIRAKISKVISRRIEYLYNIFISGISITMIIFHKRE